MHYPLRVRMLIALCLLSLFALSLGSGCGQPITPPVRTDAGGPTDRPNQAIDTGPGDDRGDRDRDGLCNATERQAQTDLDRADTDGDGIIDFIELSSGSDPNNPRDPPQSDHVTLVESAEHVAALEVFTDVEGGGDVFSLTGFDRTPGLDGRLAGEVVRYTVDAVGADPLGFVQSFAGERFVGVSGQVRLHWRVSFRPRVIIDPDAGVSTPGCRRTYDLVLAVQRAGGDAVETRTVTLDLVPPTVPPNGVADASVSHTVPWPSVNSDGLCLPLGPCR